MGPARAGSGVAAAQSPCPRSYFADAQVTLYHGNSLEVARSLPSGHVQCIITSPPRFDRSVRSQPAPPWAQVRGYVERLRALFAELHRVLADDGTAWIHLADAYSATADSAQHQLLGVPWRVALALSDDGWMLRNSIVWNRQSPQDSDRGVGRLTRRHDYIFVFAKTSRPWFDLDAVRPRTGWPAQRQDAHRDLGDVWSIRSAATTTSPRPVVPPALLHRAILAGSRPGATILDPHSGAGATGLAAQRTGRRYIGIDGSHEQLAASLRTRLRDAAMDFTEGEN